MNVSEKQFSFTRAALSTCGRAKNQIQFSYMGRAGLINSGGESKGAGDLAKAGMDVVELRRQYGHCIAFCGNSNIQVWETGDRDAIRREVLRKLNAAKGGGFIFQSDHSVSSSVSGHTHDFIVKLVREYGNYPVQLGEFEERV